MRSKYFPDFSTKGPAARHLGRFAGPAVRILMRHSSVPDITGSEDFPMQPAAHIITALTTTLAVAAALAGVQPGKSPPAKTSKLDGRGDPLPPGALVRLGTQRFQVPSFDL